MTITLVTHPLVGHYPHRRRTILLASILSGLLVLILITLLTIFILRRRRTQKRGTILKDAEETDTPFIPGGHNERGRNAKPGEKVEMMREVSLARSDVGSEKVDREGGGGDDEEKEMLGKEKGIEIKITHPGNLYDMDGYGYAAAGPVDTDEEVGRRGTMFYRNQ